MNDSTLRARLIRLAKARPALRLHLLPLLRNASAYDAVAILNTGEKLNPSRPQGNDIFDLEEILNAHICIFRKKGGNSLIVVFGHGWWKLGNTVTFQGDQSRRLMGEYDCVGTTGAFGNSGLVPNKTLPMYVVK
jgi:hypothetical protein